MTQSLVGAFSFCLVSMFEAMLYISVGFFKDNKFKTF